MRRIAEWAYEMLSFLKSTFGTRSTSLSKAMSSARCESLAAPEDATTYGAELMQIISRFNAHAQEKIRSVTASLPPKLSELHFGIHPDQDGEGTFSVMMHAEGPDLFVLDKSLDEYRVLFDVMSLEGGLNVAVPLFDPGEVEYSVNDIIADTAAVWIEERWKRAGSLQPELPFLIFSADDWGSNLPRWIQGAPK